MNKILANMSLVLSLFLLAVMMNSCDNTSQPNPYSSSSRCQTTCCDTLKYHSISEGELDTGVINYRNFDWWKTSPYFNSDRPLNYTNMKLARNNATRTLDPQGFDARYMDIDLEELENYICTVKKIAKDKSIDKIRFYYIRYADTVVGMRSPNFAQKHSLAMIPVSGDTEIAEFNDKNSLIFSPQGTSNTNIANHNNLCPPEPPACSGRLSTLDQVMSSYR